MTLDALDVAVLSQLQEDGRRSFTDMADALGVSIGTVRNRYARLLASGTLRVVGRADPHRVGFRAPATLHLRVRPSRHLDAAAEALAELPETSYVAIVSGEYDLEVDVMCRDVEHLAELLTERVLRVPGVVDQRTDMILRVVKYAQPNLRLLRTSQPES